MALKHSKCGPSIDQGLCAVQLSPHLLPDMGQAPAQTLLPLSYSAATTLWEADQAGKREPLQ